MEFKPPTQAERLQAIGATEGLPKVLQKAFYPGPDFEPIPIPKRGDWLAEHAESGQTFEDFTKEKWNRPTETRSTIYLQLLGKFPKNQSPCVEILREYVAVYFAMEVKILPPLALGEQTLTARINPYTGNRQILTTDVLSILQKNLPADSFCILAITMEDLYPHPSWNFVFGQASLNERVGIYSFARYDPVFYGKERGGDYQKLLLTRSCRVIVHEIAHMFGLKHCIFFKCVLNGSNHLEESDSRPLHLCPVCLRKLQFSIEFDVVNRLRSLTRFYKKVGFDNEAHWTANRLQRILEAEKGK